MAVAVLDDSEDGEGAVDDGMTELPGLDFAACRGLFDLFAGDDPEALVPGSDPEVAVLRGEEGRDGGESDARHSVDAEFAERLRPSVEEVDSPVGADPERAVAGFEEGDDAVFAQPLRFGEAGDVFFDDVESVQTAADGSDPEHAGTILEQGADFERTDGVRNGEFWVVVCQLGAVRIVFVEALIERSDPEFTLAVLKDDAG